jgi:hypothetical protein
VTAEHRRVASALDAAAHAHACLSGQLLVQGFNLQDFTREAVEELPADERLPFAVQAFWSAVLAHAATITQLASHGLDVQAVLAEQGAALATAASEHHDPTEEIS